MATIQTTTRLINVKESQKAVMCIISDSNNWISVTEITSLKDGVSGRSHESEQKTCINVNHIIEIQS
jgi:hypothetical protein